MSTPPKDLPNDYVERDPDTVAVYQRHPTIRQKPLIPWTVHYPECNVWCNERGHYLLSSGPQGSPFSHQEDDSDQAGVP